MMTSTDASPVLHEAAIYSKARFFYRTFVSHRPEAYYEWEDLSPLQQERWKCVARAAMTQIDGVWEEYDRMRAECGLSGPLTHRDLGDEDVPPGTYRQARGIVPVAEGAPSAAEAIRRVRDARQKGSS